MQRRLARLFLFEGVFIRKIAKCILMDVASTHEAHLCSYALHIPQFGRIFQGGLFLLLNQLILTSIYYAIVPNLAKGAIQK